MSKKRPVGTLDSHKIAEVIRQYRAAALEFAAATDAGRFSAANPAVDRIVRCVRQLDGFGRTARLHLKALLEDANPHVVTWAATHLLTFDTGMAEAKLIGLSSGRGAAAFDARIVLEEWRTGRLRPTE